MCFAICEVERSFVRMYCRMDVIVELLEVGSLSTEVDM